MKQQNLSLAEIRQALAAADAGRMRKDLSQEERQLMEQTCVTLRDAERSAITDAETGLIKGFSDVSQNVNLQAKRIRAMVTRMNSLPKALDTGETVLKECVKVLKAIATWVLSVVLLVSCATVSKSQLQRINALATAQDSITLGPKAVFQTLSDVRQERGLIYTASLTDTESRIKELNAMAKAAVREDRTLAKADVCLNILSGYANALKSLSADARWKRYGTELRGIGRNIDSLAIAYNRLEWGTLYEPGMARNLGKTGGYLTEQYMKRRQRRMLDDVLRVGDTIVATCCDALVASLESDNFIQLIDNEEQGLEGDYRAYLNSMSVQGRYPESDVDRVYLAQKARIEKARKLRKGNISTLKSLKRAHAALLKEMSQPRTYGEFSAELFELNVQLNNLVALFE